jgi:hypothetical protein
MGAQRQPAPRGRRPPLYPTLLTALYLFVGMGMTMLWSKGFVQAEQAGLVNIPAAADNLRHTDTPW